MFTEDLQVGLELVVAEILATKHGALRCDQVPRDVEAQALPVSRAHEHPTPRENLQMSLPGGSAPARVYGQVDLARAVLSQAFEKCLLPEVYSLATETSGEVEPVRGEVGDHDGDLRTQQYPRHSKRTESDGTRTGDRKRSNVLPQHQPAPYGVPRGAHDVEEHGRLRQGNVFSCGEEDVLAYEDVRSVAAVPVETDVAQLVRALVGEAKCAATTLAAEIHQVDHTPSTDGHSSPGPRIHHDPRRLVSPRHTGPVEELASLGPAQRVGLHPDQQLPPARFLDRLAHETYVTPPQKPGDNHLGGCHLTGHPRCLSAILTLDP